MIPQFIFSLFLLALSISSYLLIFRSLRQQQRLTALKNDFISNITHELKTPITTVSVALEAMNSFHALNNPTRTREYLNISKSELNRLSILVDKVLKMSIFEDREPRISLESIDLKTLTLEILNSMKLQFEQRRARVKTHFSKSEYSIQADRIHLTSVIYNLLDNALKYSPGPSPVIDVRLQNEQGRVLLLVKDEGIGIPAAYRTRIFDKFFRVPTGDRHDIKGHGLGLSYVASVVEKHGGSIEVSSTEGAGSTFTVILPAASSNT